MNSHGREVGTAAETAEEEEEEEEKMSVINRRTVDVERDGTFFLVKLGKQERQFYFIFPDFMRKIALASLKQRVPIVYYFLLLLFLSPLRAFFLLPFSLSLSLYPARR